MKSNDVKRMAQDILRAVWRSVSHNFWYKALAVLIAVILWSYVITSNPSITRPKVLEVDIRLTGESSFKSQGLALVTDVTAESPTASVRVDVPQQSYQTVSAQNVTADLDLSQIRSTGKQMVKLKGTTVLGSIAQVQPDSIEIEVDKKAYRDVPVNPTEINKKENYWTNPLRTDPSTIRVDGPAKVVERIASAEIVLDYSKLDHSQSVTFAPRFLDAEGNEVEGYYTPSSSTVTVDVEVYPTKTLPVTLDRDDLLTGAVPTGYEVDDVTASPSVITVAAEQELLDTLTEVQLKAVDVSRATQSFNRLTGVSQLAGVKKYFTENVNVKVDIRERRMSKSFSERPVKLVGLDTTKFQAKWSNPTADVGITELYSVVNKLSKDDLHIYVDLSDVTKPGTYERAILVRVDNYPEIYYSVTPQVATVTVTAKE